MPLLLRPVHDTDVLLTAFPRLQKPMRALIERAPFGMSFVRDAAMLLIGFTAPRPAYSLPRQCSA